MHEMRESNEAMANQLEASEKEVKDLTVEWTRMRARIQRLKQRKAVKFTALSCKVCNEEFEESENYNWSCRTHHSKWGGYMWWCCGKKTQDAPGCKFSKHINKDAEENDESDQDE